MIVRRSMGEAPSVMKWLTLTVGRRNGVQTALSSHFDLARLSPERIMSRRPAPGPLLDVGHEARERQDRVRHDVAVVAGVDRRGLSVVGHDVHREQATDAHYEGWRVTLLRPVRADQDSRGEPIAMGDGNRFEVGATVLF